MAVLTPFGRIFVSLTDFRVKSFILRPPMSQSTLGEYLMLCAIWYNLYNLKNVKITHGRMLLLVKHSSMGAFHDFKIVPVVPNCPKRVFFFKQRIYILIQIRLYGQVIDEKFSPSRFPEIILLVFSLLLYFIIS